LNLALAFVKGNTFSRDSVHIFEVAAKVAALSESLPAFGAGKRPLASVLSEVITKVTAFFKDRTTTAMSTLKV
jgi:hypothetical protein